MAAFGGTHQDRLTQVGKFYPRPALRQLPPKPRGKKRAGRPRVKGEWLPTPEDVVNKGHRFHELLLHPLTPAV